MDTEITITGSHEQDHQDKQKKLGQKIPDFHEMPPSKKRLWAFIIGVLFLCWLALVFFGLSYDSSKYHNLFFGIDANLKEKIKAEPGHPTLTNLVIYIFSFTPINVAIVSAVTALIGGLVSNLVAANKYDHEWRTRFKPNSEEFRVYMFMTEHPMVAMIRGFVVYLLILTGASLTNFTSAVDPDTKFNFAGASAPSYFKFCVTVSLLSYLVGFDPSRLKSILSGVNVPKKEDPSLAQTNGKLLDVINRLDIRLRNEPEKNHQNHVTAHQPTNNNSSGAVKKLTNNHHTLDDTTDEA